MSFNLKKELNKYNPIDEAEIENVDLVKKFLAENENCFVRTNFKGHITGSGLVIDRNKNVLLNHHKELDKWYQFGGHSDGEENTYNVAKREVIEESGITEFYDNNEKIFDVDVHLIPESKRKNEPEHYHYDIRFLFIAKNKEFKISDESTELKWMTIEEAKKIVGPATIRMLNKVEKLVI